MKLWLGNAILKRTTEYTKNTRGRFSVRASDSQIVNTENRPRMLHVKGIAGGLPGEDVMEYIPVDAE